MTQFATVARKLAPFQLDGSNFLQTHRHALLADEPGLGKTLQAIHAAIAIDLRRVLVICPASVRTNWYQEIHEAGAQGIWDVMSYEQAARGDAHTGYYDGIILDEAHYLKTPESQRTQAIFGKSGAAHHPGMRARWALTGTPVLNRPRELWAVLKCLNPSFADETWPRYAQRYCAAHFNGREIDTRGASHLDELQDRLRGFMLRRRKADVWHQLPAKIITRVPLKLSATAQHMIELAESDILDREAKVSAAAENFSALGDLAKLLHATGVAKVNAVTELVTDLLQVQEKVVVFFKHTEVGAALQAAFMKLGFAPTLYQGGMSDSAKNGAVEFFKRDTTGCRVFLGQIQAAGTGINGLQEVASSVVFAELSWVPGEMSQAIDRLHRIGQRQDSVHAYVTFAPGSMEGAVLGVQNSKGSVVGRLMGEDGWKV